MVAIGQTISKVECSWDDVMAGHFPVSPARQLFTSTVLDVAAQAKAALPEANGRVERARDLVLGGLVTPQQGATFTVRSERSKSQVYTVTPEGCDCPDAAQLADGACKHRIATWIWRKSRAVVEHQAQAAGDTPPTVAETAAAYHTAPTLPEAPASVNVHVELAGRTVQITLRDASEQRLLERLRTLLAQFPAGGHEADATPTTAAGQPHCRYHGAQDMRPSRYGEGKHYCAVRLADDRLCGQSWPARKK
jgi:hypothetical protein